MMHFRRLSNAFAVCLFLCAGQATAQAVSDGAQPPATAPDPDGDPTQPAILVADQVYVTPQRQLIAQGNVEALQNGVRITAQKIVYDEQSGSMQIFGPIRIEQNDGQVVILADGAEMDGDLQSGLIRSARVVFGQQIQMSALQMNRIDGRYNQLFKTAVTSCKVCEDGREPLWQIRARKVVHDEVDQQIYFEDAQFRIGRVPVMYLPRLRVPDPTAERAAGFLRPSIRSTSELGTGIKVPYFIPFGDSRDLTLEPYLSPNTATLSARYRQAFHRGTIKFQGSLSDDNLHGNGLRGYLYGEGDFNLRDDWTVDFDLKMVSDNAYLSNYGITNADRLKSEAGLQRIRRDEATRITGTYYRSMRDDEQSDVVPSIFANARYQKRLFPWMTGGEIALAFEANAYERTSTANTVGRDVARASGDLVWFDHQITPMGFRQDWRAGFAGDLFQIRNDSTYQNVVLRGTPRASYRLSRPMARFDKSGNRQVLEPVAQLGLARTIGGDVPNDESRFVEFDQGDILSLSRFPAADTRENAATFVYGFNWAKFAKSGLETHATVAQVLRSEADSNFSKSSGLSGVGSDFLLAAQMRLGRGIWVGGRTLLTPNLTFAKSELRGRFERGLTKLETTYTFLESDLGEDRPDPIHELWFDSQFKLADNWRSKANIRYSFTDSRPRDAGLSLIYLMECVELDFSLRRRYTSNENLAESTSFGFSIKLAGFSGPATVTTQAGSCKR
jgi:LPS-assembly protein